MNIGKRIKEIRIRRGLTEKQLGEKIGKSASAISNYENNFRGLNAEILVKIIKVLDVEPNYLFQDYFDDKRYAFRQEEVDFISDYRSLDLQGQIVINNSLASELGRVRDDLDFARKIMRPFYRDIRDYYENNVLGAVVCAIDDTPFNHRATSMIVMPDDSMEPLYPKGSRILVRNSENVALHEAGVFLVNDEILIRTRGNNELLTKNDSYPPIPYSEDIQPLAIVLGLPDHNGPLK